MDKYEIVERIGRGISGEVYLALTSSQKKVAIKKISVSSNGISKNVMREIQSLNQLCTIPFQSDHIVEIIESFPDSTNICIVLEYLQFNLSDIINNESFLISQLSIKTFAKMILCGLNYCHSIGIVHRDIKPSNILVSSSGIAKLADFGLARPLNINSISNNDPLTYQVATRWYRPPELLFASKNYDFSIDIWSAGTVIAELINRSPLFPGSNDIDQIFKVFQIMGTPTIENWPDVILLPDYNKIAFPTMEPIDFSYIMPCANIEDINFLMKLLVLNPKSRITAKEACSMNYFYTHPLPLSNIDMTAMFEIQKSSKKIQSAYKMKDIKIMVDEIFQVT
jgi:serine/threonine protein kinase